MWCLGCSVVFRMYCCHMSGGVLPADYGNKIIPCTLNQLEENAVMIGYDKCAKFVDKQGNLKPSNKQASQLSFEFSASAIGQSVFVCVCVWCVGELCVCLSVACTLITPCAHAQQG